MADPPHKVDPDPWIKPMQAKVGAKKWIRSARRFDRDWYFSSLDEWRARWVTAHGAEPSDAALVALVVAITEGLGDLRAHAAKENVHAASRGEWAEMVEAAGWAVVERYFKDVEKGKWP